MFNYLRTCIKQLPIGSVVVCVGDDNINLSSKNALTSVVKDFSRSCNLSQLIDSPTRITEHSSSLIDLIFSNSTNISKSGSIFCGLSDHNLIYCCIKCQKIKLPPKTIKFRDFKDFNGTAFNSDLINADWSNFFNSVDVDTATHIFNTNLLFFADQHAPFRERKVKGKTSPWITDELIKAIKERDYLLKVAARSKDQANWVAYKRKRNSVNKLKNSLKGTHYQNAFRENRDNPGTLEKS
jgi:hypothetical protein